MVRHGQRDYVTDAERREFLKALGVAGAVTAGGLGLETVREEATLESAAELAPVGRAIQSDLTGTMDATLIADGQGALATAASELPSALERGLPADADAPRAEFAPVAEAGRPVYEHLVEAGFFESTTDRLPEFDPSYLESAVGAFVGSEALAEPLSDFGATDGAGVDLLAEVVANAEELSEYHWLATDDIPREEIEFGEYIPSMTRGAAGGALLWLEDLDHHLWSHQVLLTEGMLEDAVWHGRSMAAGLHLVAEGARAVAAGDGTYDDGELASLLSTGFAVLAIAQGLLPQDVYWITEEMRDERRTDLGKASSARGR